MSKVELSDAELIATLKATAWHLSKRLTAHNVELDELRKIVERQEALVKAAKEAGRPYLMIQDLAPAQKEAPVERRCNEFFICHWADGDRGEYCQALKGHKGEHRPPQAAPHDQAAQLTQARAFLQALSSGMYEPEIWMEIKVWLAANPAPTTEVPRCPQCGEAATYRLPDGQWFDGNAHAWRTPATEDFPDGVCFHGVPLELECRQCAEEAP